MTLATTCPRCKTSFRVVADQLKLRRGMVRCGVCQNVFNGLEHLRYVEALIGAAAADGTNDPTQIAPPRPEPFKINVPPIKVSSPPVFAAIATPPPATPLAPQPTPLSFAPSSPEGTMSTGFSAGFGGAVTPTPQTQFSDFNLPRTIPVSLTPASSTTASLTSALLIPASPTPAPYSPISDADLDDIYPANRNPNTEFLNERGLGESTTLTRSDDDVHTAFFLPESVPAEMQSEVIKPPRSIQTSYVGNVNTVNTNASAGKAATTALSNNRTASPAEEDAVDFFSSEDSYGTTHDRASHWIRRSLIGLLLIGLLVQGLLLARNWLSIRLPSVQPTLDAVASVFGMKVEIPRNLSMLTIESFDVQSTARPDILSVSAIVRNRSAYSVQWPAMELTLTGTDGRPVLRKVLLPREYLNQAPTDRGVPGGSEHPIRIGLQTEPIEAKGFSVNIFYP